MKRAALGVALIIALSPTPPSPMAATTTSASRSSIVAPDDSPVSVAGPRSLAEPPFNTSRRQTSAGTEEHILIGFRLVADATPSD